MRDGRSPKDIAARENCTVNYVRLRATLAFLSPRIQAAIVEGTQPPELTLERIVRAGIPLDWTQQERLFGFDA